MKTKLALGLLAVAATLIASRPALAQQPVVREPVKVESTESSRSGDLYAGDSGQQPDYRLVAPGPVPPVATGKLRDPRKADAGRAGCPDSISLDTVRDGRCFKDIAPFGE
jgi:hypothetical protein